MINSIPDKYKPLPVSRLVDVCPVFVRNQYVGYVYRKMYNELALSHSLERAISKVVDVYDLTKKHYLSKELIEEIVAIVVEKGMWIFSDAENIEEAKEKFFKGKEFRYK